MKTVFIGEIIRQRRRELKLSQEQLCEGICDPVSISRIENGKQSPSKILMDSLLERLGLPVGKYYAFLNKEEEDIDNLKKEIISCNVFRNSEKGLEKIAELENIADPENPLIHQFILRSKASLGVKGDDSKIRPYSFEEKLDLLMQAIHLTVPKFNLDEIEQCLYDLDEIKIINHIAQIYSDHQEHQKSIDIYYQLLKYIKKHFQNILQSGGLLPLVAYNYARELDLVGRYQEAIQIAELGWQSCIQYGYYTYLSGALAVMAESYYFLGDSLKSEEFYHYAYYTSKGLHHTRNAQIIREEAKKYLDIDFKF